MIHIETDLAVVTSETANLQKLVSQVASVSIPAVGVPTPTASQTS